MTTDELRAATRRAYADIIDKRWPEDIPDADALFLRHPRMPVANRAKAFAPFAALRGHGDRLNVESDKLLRQRRMELSEADELRLSERLKRLKKGMEIAALYFLPDPSEPELGYYARLQGRVAAIDLIAQTLRIGDTTISFSALSEIYLEKPH